MTPSKMLADPSPPRRRARTALGQANGLPQPAPAPTSLKPAAADTAGKAGKRGCALLAHAAEVAALVAAVRGGALGVAVHTLTLSGAGEANKLGADAGRRVLAQGEPGERERGADLVWRAGNDRCASSGAGRVRGVFSSGRPRCDTRNL